MTTTSDLERERVRIVGRLEGEPHADKNEEGLHHLLPNLRIGVNCGTNLLCTICSAVGIDHHQHSSAGVQLHNRVVGIHTQLLLQLRHDMFGGSESLVQLDEGFGIGLVLLHDHPVDLLVDGIR